VKAKSAQREAMPDKPNRDSVSARREKSSIALTDSELISKIRASKQGAKFSALFDSGYAVAGSPSNSEAVAALLHILAFWTAKDAARMDAIFRQSACYVPEKWDRK
jgi:putative DNA primase/helicase